MSEYNENALYYHEQVVILDTTNAGSTSGGLIVRGGISGKDTYITGHVAVNNVKITPNKNDIIFEQQAVLNRTESFTDITDFYFDDSVANSFKAIINVTVSGGVSKYALWEINGIYKPSGWLITSSFTGDQTGINFKIVNSNGRGQIQYTNSNVEGTTTTIRYRANTTAPPGTTPLGSDSGFINNTSGPYIANRLLYSNSTDTIANTDLIYNSNVFTIGGTSRILAQSGDSFTNFSNGGAITSMGDASVAKKMIVGEKVGIVTTAPQFNLDVTGDINFTGNFYKNGSLYSGSSIWDTNANSEIFTQQNLGIGTSDPTYKLDVSGGIRVTEAITAGALYVTNEVATNISSGTLNLSTGLTSGSANVTDITSTNASIATLNVTALTAGNINFTGTLYENGTPYVNSQWTTGTGGNLSYTNGNVGINTTAPEATLDVRGTVNVSTGITAANLNVSGISILSDVTTGTLSASTINSSLVAANTITGGSLSLSGDLFVAGSLTAVNITTTNLMDTNITASIAKITDASITTATIATLLNTNQNSTNVSTATLNISSGLTSASAQITNQSSTNISAATLNISTGITSNSLQVTNADLTTASIATLVATNQTATNVSSATLSLSTGLTASSAQITNAVVTNVTSTNIVATNSSLGTINASGATIGGNMVPSLNVTYDLGSASLRWRDLYLSGNTIHLGEKQLTLSGDAFTIEKINLLSTDESVSSTSGALVVNGGVGISKSLNVNGTVSSSLVSSTNVSSINLTAGSLQVTNENVTSSSIGTARVTTSLLAVGNSNTIGNIFTNNSNVGIGVVNPSLALEVSGRSLMKSAGTGTSGALYLDDINKGIEYSGNNGSVNSYFGSGFFPNDGIAVFGYADGALGTKQGGNKVALAWNSSGNVGIGTNSPSNRLDVSGTARITTSVTTGALFSTNVTSTNIVATNSSMGTINAGTINASGATVNGSIYINSADGNQGGFISTSGESESLNKLIITNNRGVGGIWLSTNVNSTVAPRMAIGSSGNIGIGTTAPSERLHVIGNILSSGSITSASLRTTTVNTTNVVATNVSSGTLNISNINHGSSNSYSGSATAGNNVSTPTNVSGLSFSTFAFTAKIVVRVNGSNLYEYFNIDGINTNSGWTIFTDSVGDVSGLTFSITSGGEIQYVSANNAGWSSTDIRYHVVQF